MLGKDVSLACYADDLTTVVKNEADLEELISALRDFESLSGLKANPTKSEALLLGEFRRDGRIQDLGMKIVDKIKVTGIYLGQSMKELEHENYDQVIANIEARLAAWRERSLSLLGRILVAKAHGQSLVQYQLGSIELPAWAANAINKLLYKFIWRSRDIIPRAMLGRSYEEGGAKFQDIRDIATAASSQWIRRLATGKERTWDVLLMTDLEKLGGIQVLEEDMNLPKEKKRTLSYSYNAVILEAWKKIRSLPSLAEVDKEDEQILAQDWMQKELWWSNSITNAEGKGFCMRGLAASGLHKLADVIDNNGRVISTNAAIAQGLRPGLMLE